MSVTPIDLSKLGDALAEGDIRLEPMREDHRAALAAVCAEDLAIWEMYAVSYGPDHFEASFDAMLADRTRLPYAILLDGVLAGMTAWIRPDPHWRTVEIGGTYLAPAHRGTGANTRIKRLLLAYGFGLGLLRIQFSIDVRNARSQAAACKIGAVKEGVLRNERITWSGHQRDSAIFSIVAREWR